MLHNSESGGKKNHQKFDSKENFKGHLYLLVIFRKDGITYVAFNNEDIGFLERNVRIALLSYSLCFPLFKILLIFTLAIIDIMALVL